MQTPPSSRWRLLSRCRRRPTTRLRLRTEEASTGGSLGHEGARGLVGLADESFGDDPLVRSSALDSIRELLLFPDRRWTGSAPYERNHASETIMHSVSYCRGLCPACLLIGTAKGEIAYRETCLTTSSLGRVSRAGRPSTASGQGVRRVDSLRVESLALELALA